MRSRAGVPSHKPRASTPAAYQQPEVSQQAATFDLLVILNDYGSSDVNDPVPSSLTLGKLLSLCESRCPCLYSGGHGTAVGKISSQVTLPLLGPHFETLD